MLGYVVRQGRFQIRDDLAALILAVGFLFSFLGVGSLLRNLLQVVLRRRQAIAHLDALNKDEETLLARAVKSNSRVITIFSLDAVALSLRAKGLIHASLVIGEDAPHTIPAYIWKILQRRKEQLLPAAERSLGERKRI